MREAHKYDKRDAVHATSCTRASVAAAAHTSSSAPNIARALLELRPNGGGAAPVSSEPAAPSDSERLRADATSSTSGGPPTRDLDAPRSDGGGTADRRGDMTSAAGAASPSSSSCSGMLVMPPLGRTGSTAEVSPEAPVAGSAAAPSAAAAGLFSPSDCAVCELPLKPAVLDRCTPPRPSIPREALCRAEPTPPKTIVMVLPFMELARREKRRVRPVDALPGCT